MILDLLDHHALYRNYNPRTAIAFDFLLANRSGELPLGKHMIEGDQVFAIVMDSETRLPKDAVWETHRKYIDIQYIARGEEIMGWAPLVSIQNKITTPYDATRDAQFYDGTGTWLEVKQGMFTIFGPQDAHAPSMRLNDCEKVLKIVMKVAV